MRGVYPQIRDLAVIGDQKTTAIVSKDGSIVWYCPQSFDNPTIFGSLLDIDKGSWKIEGDDITSISRNYIGETGILETHIQSTKGKFTIKDWMPVSTGTDIPTGICRQIYTQWDELHISIAPAPDYGRAPLELIQNENFIIINDQFFLFSSHALHNIDQKIYCTIPANQEGWMFLSDRRSAIPRIEEINYWYESTLNHWNTLAMFFKYEGIFQKELCDSVRAIRLLTNDYNGGIIAAPTSSLPEVIGGFRNYDYRYVWLRDAGMIASALTRAGSNGIEGRKFLDFICDTAHKIPNFHLKPLFGISQNKVNDEIYLDYDGYQNSKPVRVGNNANEQLQLDSLGNVLLAAELIYQKTKLVEHWDIIEHIADFLSDNWMQPDYGLWEENHKRQYTSSKVIVCNALEYISEYQEDFKKRRHWKNASKEIRNYIMNKCLTSTGAFAVYEGSETVDVSASLFSVWGFTPHDAPEMKATMEILERDYCRNNLYWRHLEDFDSRKEGAFMAGTFWVAQYWVMTGNVEKAHRIIDAALEYSNDVGLFAEEADPETGQMLGNIPQSFVHAAFIATVSDLNNAIKKM